MHKVIGASLSAFTCHASYSNHNYSSQLLTSTMNAMTDTALSISQADIESLEQLYTFRGKTEIIQFLNKYPFFVATLQSAIEKIRSYFPNEQLFLRIDYDPEIIDYVHLVLSILTERNPHDALNKLNQFDEDWLQPLPYEVQKHLITIPEFHDNV